VQKRRQVKKLDMLLSRIAPLLKTDEDGHRRIEDGWVMTGYEGQTKDPTIRFKPIRVDEHAKEVLWERGKQFLLMSATLISPAQMAQDLGLDEDEWAVVHLDSTFPIENRPVFVPAVASMTNKTKAEAWPVMATEIETIIKENPNTRILIHTVSYHLTKYLHDNISSIRTMMYLNAKERERVLKEFLNMDDAVLLAPSFERGIDLPEEDCEVIIIAKVPYPYLGDKQISARMYGKGGQVWYAVQTIRAIAQMTGRGMRSKDDWCDVFIMDSQFKRLFREHKRLFPKWWRDSLVLSMNDPKNKPMVKAMKGRRDKR
jgi:Rad3-related DNA helicase